MEQVYSASAVSRPFWYVEFKKVMSLLNRGMSYEEIRTKALEDNSRFTIQVQHMEIGKKGVTHRRRCPKMVFVDSQERGSIL